MHACWLPKLAPVQPSNANVWKQKKKKTKKNMVRWYSSLVGGIHPHGRWLRGAPAPPPPLRFLVFVFSRPPAASDPPGRALNG